MRVTKDPGVDECAYGATGRGKKKFFHQLSYPWQWADRAGICGKLVPTLT